MDAYKEQKKDGVDALDARLEALVNRIFEKNMANAEYRNVRRDSL